MRLSVIMPSYNTPQSVLVRSISSVINAISADDELIVVDDKSNSHIDAFEYVKRMFPAVRIIHQESNRGQAYARNTGMDLAQGEFIAFIDSDDEVLEFAYSKSIEALNSTGADIVVYGVKTIWQGLHLSKVDRLSDKNYGVLDSDDFGEIWAHRLFTYPWNKVYRRSFLDSHKIRFKESCIPREDEVLNFECVIKKAQWVSISYVGHVYYHQSSSSLGRFRPYNRESNLAVERSRIECVKSLGCEDGVRFRMKRMTEHDLCKSDWLNIWRKESPYSYWERYKWLRRNMSELSLVEGIGIYFKTWIWALIRKYFYFRFIQRSHIKKLHRNIVSD